MNILQNDSFALDFDEEFRQHQCARTDKCASGAHSVKNLAMHFSDRFGIVDIGQENAVDDNIAERCTCGFKRRADRRENLTGLFGGITGRIGLAVFDSTRSCDFTSSA